MSPLAALPRVGAIEGVAQAVTDQVEAQHRDGDCGTRIEHQLRRGEEEVARVIEHGAPLRRWRLCAEAKETEAGNGEYQFTHLERGEDNDRRQDTRQYVPCDDATVAGAEGSRGLDIAAFPVREHQSANDARVPGPAG